VRGVRSAAPAGGPTSGPARKRDAQAQQDGECCKHTSETTKKKKRNQTSLLTRFMKSPSSTTVRVIFPFVFPEPPNFLPGPL
jgi:hypothetical protein